MLSDTPTAAYQDLNLTINSTLNSATCTAHGGYPEPEVKWTGQNKSSGEQLKLKDAQTSHQQHPTKKTFSVTSTVSVKELKSVTCHVYNRRSNQQIKNTAVIDAPGEAHLRDRSTIVVSIGVVAAILLLLLFVCFLCRRCKKSEEGRQQAVNQEDLAANEVPADGNAPDAPSNLPEGQDSNQRPQPEENDEDSADRNAPVASPEGQESQEGPQQAVNQEDSAANEVPADGNAPDAPSNLPEGQESQEGPQQAVNQEDSAAGGVPAGKNAPVASSNSSEGDVSEGKVLLTYQTGSSHFSVKQDADDASNEDTTAAAAATADTEEKTKLLSDSKEDSDETKSTKSVKDK
ncbi:protein IWS1 homolog isoform X1 [Thunnus albacares]|uniref:protein IWS1 homolog isoform X1 n=1 Tax=Thunnus albacares TaxID=8236 RepID=UPI001CF65E3D|nr:protein IWS1 homolog isoform X1 [Thunnus albacares]